MTPFVRRLADVKREDEVIATVEKVADDLEKMVKDIRTSVLEIRESRKLKGAANE